MSAGAQRLRQNAALHVEVSRKPATVDAIGLRQRGKEPKLDMTRILLIDDEEPVRLTLAGLLRTAGHEPVGAADGEEGLGLFRRQAFDLVITDVLMPRRGGAPRIKPSTRRPRGCDGVHVSATKPGELASSNGPPPASPARRQAMPRWHRRHRRWKRCLFPWQGVGWSCHLMEVGSCLRWRGGQGQCRHGVVRRDPADDGVAGVRDINVAGAVDHEAARLVEQTHAAGAVPQAGDARHARHRRHDAARVDSTDRAVAGICDKTLPAGSSATPQG